MGIIEDLEATLCRKVLVLPGGPFGFAAELVKPSMSGLFPSEAELVVVAVDRRRQEFAAGRRCARRALASIAGPQIPILMGPIRQPIWPDCA